MANLHSQFTYDDALNLKDAALVAASADESVIVDIGNGFVDAFLVIDVSAIETDSSNETYAIILEGSPDAAFGTAANITALTRTVMGHSSGTALAPTGTTTTTGRFAVPFTNEVNGTMYRYLRLRTVVAGTVGTGINYSAFVAKR